MILTAAGVVMILVAMTYAYNILGTRMAENEFLSSQQFMSTTGKQIDDIAWTIGRTQTVTYSSQYGMVNFVPATLTYSVDIHTSSGWQPTLNYQTGIVDYNMPVSFYTRGNGYFELIPNYANRTFLEEGSTAPVSQVFSAQKVPMHDGNYLRTVVAPTVRILDSGNYFKFYLPTLANTTNFYRSQSLTMSGDGISKVTQTGVDQVKVTLTFSRAGEGFDSSFFNFRQVTETKTVASGSIVEFYVASVNVAVGNS